jgi:hypothetical protein
MSRCFSHRRGRRGLIWFTGAAVVIPGLSRIPLPEEGAIEVIAASDEARRAILIGVSYPDADAREPTLSD